MNPQPDLWVGALGVVVVFFGMVIAIATGMAQGKKNPQEQKNWDLFELGEIVEKPVNFYKPSPTNIMRDVDRARRG